MDPLLWLPTWRGSLARFLYRSAWRIIESRIPDDERIWRSVSELQVADDGTLTSGYFRGQEVSCDLARFSTPERSRRGYGEPPWSDQSGLVEITTRLVRDHGTDVKHAPSLSPRNYSHSLFTSKLTTGQAKRLATVASTNFKVKPQFNSQRGQRQKPAPKSLSG